MANQAQHSSIFILVTKHWPKIATALVAVVGITELLLDLGQTDSNIEWYLLAWGSMTGGLWFIFDIAEKSTSIEAKAKVTSWIKQDGGDKGLAALPQRFTTLFDQIFGKKHLSWLCFRRSVIASILSAWIVSSFLFGVHPSVFGEGFAGSLSDPLLDESVINIGVLGLLALFVNLVPDYLSLLQTRHMLNWINRGTNTLIVLFLDAILTGLIFIAYLSLGIAVLWYTFFALNPPQRDYPVGELVTVSDVVLRQILSYLREVFFIDRNNGNTFGILLITTYFTSVWLWLYIAVMWISRVLIRLNNGVGFLLGVMDVDTQPLRSLGFISVLLVSALFILGLPFVF